jgi:hypothetical protein
MRHEQTDAVAGRAGAAGLQGESPPRCPQLRACHAKGMSPVHGYCVLADTPGWFMIPSLTEYRAYCTTPRWDACGWFGVGSHDRT